MIIKHRKGESYQHAAAKAVFMHWLKLNDGNFGPFGWQGYVWEEYPFIEGYADQVLSEVHPEIYMADPPIPTYEELALNNIYPFAIADIAISHKGSIYYVIEIVHKNEISNEKIAKLERLITAWGVEIWRIEAHWILSQIEVPTNFPEACIRRVGNYGEVKLSYTEALKDRKSVV